MIKNNLSYDNFPFEYKLQCPILKTILCYFISHDKKTFYFVISYIRIDWSDFK